MESSKDKCYFMLFMESVYMWLLGELFHRPRQRYEYYADVTKSCISFTASALKNSTKVACLLNKEQQAGAKLQQPSTLIGRLKKAYRRVNNCGSIIIGGIGSWCRFGNTHRNS